MSKQVKSIHYLSLLSLVALSGCWKGDSCCSKTEEVSAIASDDDSTVLLSIGDSAKITVNSLDADLNELAEMDQQAKMMLTFDPEGTKERMFKEQKRMAVVEEWAVRNGVREDAEYKKKQSRIISHVQKQLDFEQFLKEHEVDVTDADVRKYYDENKDQDYRIVVSQAGVKTQAVEFDTKEAADKFAEELKKAGAKDIEKLAKGKKLFARSFGNINDSSYADKEIKDAVLKLKKFPTVVVIGINDKKKYWVVAALAKEKAKYQDFDKIKDSLKQAIKPKKIGEMLEVKLPEYSAEFKVVENEGYFKDLKAAKEAEAAKQAQESGKDSKESK